MRPKKVLILGSYGNFGRHIIEKLAAEGHIQLILNGRSQQKCDALAALYSDVENPPYSAPFDFTTNLVENLQRLQPEIVIHTCGPFQYQNYTVAEACIQQGCHYIDLADGRDFVSNIDCLNAAAIGKNVSIITGASSVPCLTAAVVDQYLPHFRTLKTIDSGIATSQRINVGLATIRGTLSYCGKPISMLKDGTWKTVYGWQGLKKRVYPGLGVRYLSYCDVPDLSLFPKRYRQLESAEFRVSLEVPMVHVIMWGLSWLVRFKLIKGLSAWAHFLKKCAHLVGRWGSNDSGFHVELNGVDKNGSNKKLTYYLIATNRYGPFIPSTPAIICAKKLASGIPMKKGAYPCLDIISLDEYVNALESEKIKIIVSDS